MTLFDVTPIIVYLYIYAECLNLVLSNYLGYTCMTDLAMALTNCMRTCKSI